jgi:hypothetical protein
MERVKGIEPSSQAWEARILPLNHTRNFPNRNGAFTKGNTKFVFGWVCVSWSQRSIG